MLEDTILHNGGSYSNMSSKTASKTPYTKKFPEEQNSYDAARNLEETPEKVHTGLQTMKEHIQRHQIPCPDDNDFLLKFLRVKKFRYKDSCKMLESFAKCMQSAYELTGEVIDYYTVKKVLENNVLGILPYRDSEGRLIAYYRIGVIFDVGLEFEDVMKAGLFLSLLLMKDASTQTRGFCFISDAKRLCASELLYIRNGLLLAAKIVVGTPMRIRRVEMINTSKFYRAFYLILKFILPSKILQRVTSHGPKSPVLLEQFDESILPNEFGGSAGPLCNQHMMDKFEENFEYARKFQNMFIR